MSVGTQLAANERQRGDVMMEFRRTAGTLIALVAMTGQEALAELDVAKLNGLVGRLAECKAQMQALLAEYRELAGMAGHE